MAKRSYTHISTPPSDIHHATKLACQLLQSLHHQSLLSSTTCPAFISKKATSMSSSIHPILPSEHLLHQIEGHNKVWSSSIHAELSEHYHTLIPSLTHQFSEFALNPSQLEYVSTSARRSARNKLGNALQLITIQKWETILQSNSDFQPPNSKNQKTNSSTAHSTTNPTTLHSNPSQTNPNSSPNHSIPSLLSLHPTPMSHPIPSLLSFTTPPSSRYQSHPTPMPHTTTVPLPTVFPPKKSSKYTPPSQNLPRPSPVKPTPATPQPIIMDTTTQPADVLTPQGPLSTTASHQPGDHSPSSSPAHSPTSPRNIPSPVSQPISSSYDYFCCSPPHNNLLDTSSVHTSSPNASIIVDEDALLLSPNPTHPTTTHPNSISDTTPSPPPSTPHSLPSEAHQAPYFFSFHPKQKGHWTLPITITPVVIIGDSNVRRITHSPLPSGTISFVSYSGGRFPNILNALKNSSDFLPNPHPKVIILSLGINHHDNKLESITKPADKLISKIQSLFPNTRLFLPLLNFSNDLPSSSRTTLLSFNTYLLSKWPQMVLPSLPSHQFQTVDSIHWNPQTANSILIKWMDNIHPQLYA